MSPPYLPPLEWSLKICHLNGSNSYLFATSDPVAPTQIASMEEICEKTIIPLPYPKYTLRCPCSLLPSL